MKITASAGDIKVYLLILVTIYHDIPVYSAKYSCITVRRETLEGSNIGEFGKKPSIRQFLNHQCFPI